jgi:hypothetical protein
MTNEEIISKLPYSPFLFVDEIKENENRWKVTLLSMKT